MRIHKSPSIRFAWRGFWGSKAWAWSRRRCLTNRGLHARLLPRQAGPSASEETTALAPRAPACSHSRFELFRLEGRKEGRSLNRVARIWWTICLDTGWRTPRPIVLHALRGEHGEGNHRSAGVESSLPCLLGGTMRAAGPFAWTIDVFVVAQRIRERQPRPCPASLRACTRCGRGGAGGSGGHRCQGCTSTDDRVPRGR